jgi:23S rRNA (guanine2445-N2)-methyltransferase / 23S rRNA (guanine2069-N7)-methyltransferase
MCGSGTFLVEAADMAMDVAPGLRRSRWGFDRWLGHSETVWRALCKEATERQQARASERDALRLVGGDADAESVRAAKDNITAAGWDDIIRIARCPVTEARPKTADPGLLVVNPPYGQRLSSPEQAAAIHGDLGNTLRHHFLGWTAGILTEHPLVGSVGLRPHRRIPIRNGPLDCRLALFDIAETAPQGRTQP